MSGTGPAAATAAPAAALLGFFSLAAQTILARELLVVFHGSELSLGLVLALWLLLGGVGSALASRALAARPPRTVAMAAGAVTAALALPAAVLGTRHAATLFALPPGVVPGIREGALLTVAALALPAAAGGAWFATAAALGRDAGGAGRAYAWESVGGILGGAVIALALGGAVDALALSCIVAGTTLAGVSWIVSRRHGRSGPATGAALAALAVAIAGPALFGGPAVRSQEARWPGLTLLAARDGRHGNLALVRASGQSTLFTNGEPALSFPDPESAEAAAHLPLLAAPRVERVLVTAEALGGPLTEVLRHPVVSVDCVVPDPETLDLVRPNLPPDLAAALGDPRVRVRQDDPRAWIARHPAAYDAILLGSVEPSSALANRLSTREFFRLARAALRPGGVAALTVTASPNYLGRELLQRNAAIARALRSAFPRVEVLRAEPLTLLASEAPEPLAVPARLAGRLRERGIAARTLSPEVIAALLEPERAASAARDLLGTDAAENRDTAPAAYLYHARHREAAADPAVARALAALDGPWRWAPFALPLLLAPLALVRRGAGALPLRSAPGLAAAATGFGAMALQFLLLFVYQTSRGLLYLGLGLLSAVFMGGLAAGSGLALLLHGRGLERRRLLAFAQGTLVVLPGILSLAFGGVLAAGTARLPLAADLLAGAAAAAGGLAAGFAFALLTLSGPGQAGAGGGYYALELAGSAAGVLVVSLWLLPLLGLPAALAFVALLHAAVTLLLRRAGAISLR